jgi:hypothetical protein
MRWHTKANGTNGAVKATVRARHPSAVMIVNDTISITFATAPTINSASKDPAGTKAEPNTTHTIYGAAPAMIAAIGTSPNVTRMASRAISRARSLWPSASWRLNVTKSNDEKVQENKPGRSERL